jgi:hypothetical protein
LLARELTLVTATFDSATTEENGASHAVRSENGINNARTILDEVAKSPEVQVTTCHTT